MKDGRIEAGVGASRPSMARLALAASAIVWCVYALTLSVARALTPLQALAAGAANTVPIILFGVAAYRAVGLWIVGRNPIVQAAGHVIVGSTFALMSYWLLIVLLGLLQGASVIEFAV